MLVNTSPSSWVSLFLPVLPCWFSWGLLSQPCSCLIYGFSPVGSTLTITSNIIYGPKRLLIYIFITDLYFMFQAQLANNTSFWKKFPSTLLYIMAGAWNEWLLEGARHPVMASSPITSWQIDGETMETVTDFIFLGSKITADGDCSHKIKRLLLLERKAMTNLDSI